MLGRYVINHLFLGSLISLFAELSILSSSGRTQAWFSTDETLQQFRLISVEAQMGGLCLMAFFKQ